MMDAEMAFDLHMNQLVVRASSGSGLRCWRRPHSSFTKGMTSGGIGKEL